MDWHIGQRTGDQWETLDTVSGPIRPDEALSVWATSNDAEAGIQYGAKLVDERPWVLLSMTPDGRVILGEV